MALAPPSEVHDLGASVSIVPHPGFFKAATSPFRVSDLVSLTFAQFTHKVELRYTDKLLCGEARVVPVTINFTDGVVTSLVVEGRELVSAS